MNTLDNLTLIIFVAAFLFYCYRKKKFIFSKLRKGGENAETTASTATGTDSIAPMPVQSIGAFSQMYPNICGIQAGNAASVTGCKLVPWTFYHVLDKETDSAQTDAFISHNAEGLEAALNSEIRHLVTKGYAVTGINAVSFIMDDLSTHVLYCIAYRQ